MAAITTAKNRLRFGEPIALGESKVAASTTIVGGGMVGVISGGAAGYLVNALTSTTLLVLGVAIKTVDNSAGAAGALSAGYEVGDFEFENSAAADLIDQGDIGATVYAVDNNTVALTNGTSTRSVAGKLVGISPAGKPVVRVGAGLGT